MPFQCRLNFKKFQECELQNRYQRQKLAEEVRPIRCPYCGQYHEMIVHDWKRRYVIDEENITWDLLIPVFRCNCCMRCIRVLPYECQSHTNYLSNVIRTAIFFWIEQRKYNSASLISRRLQQTWVTKFCLRIKEKTDLLRLSLSQALNRLPPFSNLFHEFFKTIYEDEIKNDIPATQRIFRLCVCVSYG